jgi:hypothetical protein
MQYRATVTRAAKLLTLLALAAAAIGVAAPPAQAADDPSAAATTYLVTRAQAVVPGASLQALRACFEGGASQAAGEAAIARGCGLAAQAIGHRIVAVDCQVSALSATVSPGGDTASVVAHAITMTTWRGANGGTSQEGVGIDHTITLLQRDGRWLVSADTYLDDQTPRFLEAAGAAPTVVHDAARRLETATIGSETLTAPLSPIAQAALAGGPSDGLFVLRRLLGYATYDNAAAKAYADKYCLTYNPTYMAYSADCANFASQTMFAGNMPQLPGDYENGWLYDKNGTSSPSNDTCTHPWIAVMRQWAVWNGRYTDARSRISELNKGDYVYYDWTADGVWDHVAEVVGTNSSGQYIVDAHTTDYYHTFWKMGTSSTKYRYAHTRTTVPLPTK